MVKYMIKVVGLNTVNKNRFTYWLGKDYEVEGPLARNMKIPYDYYVEDSGFDTRDEAKKLLKNISTVWSELFNSWNELLQVSIIELDPEECPKDEDDEDEDLYD